jgi:signal transduction histidine kinase/ligand-binding sensor domain-containing protein/AraC-like DNA-binding protein
MFKKLLLNLSIFFTVLGLIALVRPNARAQRKLKFTSLTVKDGLSSNIVNNVLKDRYGLMWFATEDGLNKYDGQKFTVYRHRAGDSTSLSANEIISMHEDKGGNLWIGTNGGQLNVYDRDKDSFVNFKSENNRQGITGPISAICSDYLGDIWVAHYNSVTIVNFINWTTKSFKLNLGSEKNTSSHDIITYVFKDRKQNMWIGTDNGLCLVDKRGKKKMVFRHAANDETSISHNSIISIGEDSQGDLWVGTRGGLNRLRKDGKGFDRFTHTADPGSLINDVVYTFRSDPVSHQLWVGTEGGLDIINPANGLIAHVPMDKRQTYSLNNQSIRSILIEPDGIYWVGTYQGGVNKFDQNLNLFEHKQNGSFDPFGLKGTLITSFAEKKKGHIYVGTDDGGLNLFDVGKGTFSHLESVVIKGKRINRPILSLALDKRGKLWIGTYGAGLWYLDPNDSEFKPFSGQRSLKPESKEIFCLKIDRQGNLWIGTNGDGLFQYSSSGKFLKKFVSVPDGPSEYKLSSNNYIRSIEEDLNGNIWIGSHGAGITCLDPVSLTSRLFNTASSGLESNIIKTLFCDSKGRICAGSVGGGLSIFSPSNGKFVSYSEDHGLANSTVYKILEDNHSNIWVSTNVGISLFEDKSKLFKNFNQYNGVQNSNFYRGSGLRSSDGMLYFGGLDGFNFFDPDLIKKNNNPPKLLLTDLRIANLSVRPGAKSAIKEHISVAKEIILKYGENFSLDFVALGFTSPKQNRYSYKLDGYENKWNNVGTQRTASYTNIFPGEYIFMVKGSNNDGVWNNDPITIRIIVKPPFYMSKWAYLVYTLALVGILAYSRYRTLKKLRVKFAIDQQKSEEEQKRELDSSKIRFLTNLSHEFRTPISLIMGPVENLIDQDAESPLGDKLKMIKRNTRRLLNLVNQLRDFGKLEDHKLRLNLEEGDIIFFIRDLSDSFSDISDRKRIDFSFTTEISTLVVLFDHDKIERILFNLLSNAFKFTPQDGQIKLLIREVDNLSGNINRIIQIRVVDSGIGISSEDTERIFDRFFQVENPEHILNQGSGIGLSITKEFVELHNGKINVESQPGRGTTFIIDIPLTRSENTFTNFEKKNLPEEAEPRQGLITQNPFSTGPLSRQTATILVIDDSDDFRVYLKDILRDEYYVITASDGKEGWQKTLSAHPSLIISDIGMPVMDGISLTKKIRGDKRTAHIPVILLTAQNTEMDELMGLDTGANDYLTKPFNSGILLTKIKNLLILNDTFKNAYSKQIRIDGPEIEVSSDKEKFLKKVRLYIEENINDDKLSVENLSGEMGMSRGSLYTKILELTGETPVEYIRTIKLERATVLLEKSDWNVAQIAYAVGFAAPNYFARSFKIKYGILPSEYLADKRKN